MASDDPERQDDGNVPVWMNRQAEADPVTEPVIRVPVPSTHWIVLVAATESRVAAIELPRAAFTDPVLIRSLQDMDSEMGKHG